MQILYCTVVSDNSGGERTLSPGPLVKRGGGASPGHSFTGPPVFFEGSLVSTLLPPGVWISPWIIAHHLDLAWTCDGIQTRVLSPLHLSLLQVAVIAVPAEGPGGASQSAHCRHCPMGGASLGVLFWRRYYASDLFPFLFWKSALLYFWTNSFCVQNKVSRAERREGQATCNFFAQYKSLKNLQNKRLSVKSHFLHFLSRQFFF